MYYWNLAWRILSITLLACEVSAIVWEFKHSLVLTFFCFGMKTDLFQSCDHCWVFQICWHIECSAFTASSFKIWNSSTGISSPLLAMFIVMLPKAHLSLHSRMSGSRWVITPLWLSVSWRSFLYSSPVYCCHLFLISSAFVAAAAKLLQSCLSLCDPIDGSLPGSPSLGFSRQEHWSGLPFPSPMHESEKWKWSCSVISDSSWPHGLQPTRVLRPWDFPGKSTGVGCHCLLHLLLLGPYNFCPLMCLSINEMFLWHL